MAERIVDKIDADAAWPDIVMRLSTAEADALRKLLWSLTPDQMRTLAGMTAEQIGMVKCVSHVTY